MAGEHIDISDEANGAAIAAAIICGLIGYGVNGGSGAVAAAIAAYGAVRMLALVLHSLMAFIVSGVLLVMGCVMLANYVGRAGKAMSRPDSPSSVAGGKTVLLVSQCPRNATLYLKWNQPGQGWVIAGPWNLVPNQTTYLQHSDQTEIRAVSDEVYIYGEVAGSDQRWQGNFPEAYGGTVLPMMSYKMSGGFLSYSLVVNCEGA